MHKPSFCRNVSSIADLFNLSVASDVPRPPLVYRFISHETFGPKRPHRPGYKNVRPKISNEVVGFEVFKSAVRIIRNFARNSKPSSVTAPRGVINSFSDASRRRLKFVAANCDPDLVSSFCLTYHNNAPVDGSVCKSQLNLFLTELRRVYHDVKYLWILEFQSRGCPHFHLFLSCPPDSAMQKFMASAWNRITSESPEHLSFHEHPSNFFTWEMGSGSYLTKYLDKEAQKFVPESFFNVGRFWGCSRGLVPPGLVVDETDLARFDAVQFDPVTGEEKSVCAKKYVARAICKFHRAKLRQYRRVSRAASVPTSYMVAAASGIFWQLFQHLHMMTQYCPF